MSFGDAGLDYALEQSLRQQAGPTPGKAFLSEFLAGLAPGAGMADAAGGFPNMQEGGTYPGWRENLADGNYGMAGMQGLGALGDLLTFAGPMGLAAGAVARAPGAAVRGAGAAQRARGMARVPQEKIDAAARKPRAYNREQTVWNPVRNEFPGIYQDPREIVRQANARMAPEDPMLKRLWGVDRADIHDIMSAGRQGTHPGAFPGAVDRPGGAQSAFDVMRPANERRLTAALEEAKGTPIERSMHGWYYMDPVYLRMEEMYGPEQARVMYDQFNHMTGMMSPGSDVLTELNRGTHARALLNQGDIDSFFRYGGGISPEQRAQGLTRAPGAPEVFDNVLGHPYHSTAHGTPLSRYLEQGRITSKEPKVPLYIQASGVPQTGFQTDTMVPDAHWSRAVGLADVRRNQAFGKSASASETQTLAPWWQERIANQVGMEPVPAQAVTWGLFSPQTGVDSPVGAGKLELLTRQISRAAEREGVTPETMRDMVLSGKRGAGFIDPTLLGGLGVGGAGAAGLGAYLMGDE